MSYTINDLINEYLEKLQLKQYKKQKLLQGVPQLTDKEEQDFKCDAADRLSIQKTVSVEVQPFEFQPPPVRIAQVTRCSEYSN